MLGGKRVIVKGYRVIEGYYSDPRGIGLLWGLLLWSYAVEVCDVPFYKT